MKEENRINRYKAARGVLAGLRVLAWVIVGLAVLVAVGVMADGGLGAALGLAGGPALGALIMLALVEMASAQLDTADNTARMVGLLERLVARENEPPVTASAMPGTGSGALIKTYKGYRILREPVGVSVDGAPFDNVLRAERWIDAQRREG